MTLINEHQWIVAGADDFFIFHTKINPYAKFGALVRRVTCFQLSETSGSQVPSACLVLIALKGKGYLDPGNSDFIVSPNRPCHFKSSVVPSHHVS